MYKYFAKRIYNSMMPTYGDIDIIVASKTPLRYNQIIKDSNGNAYIIYLDIPEDENDV